MKIVSAVVLMAALPLAGCASSGSYYYPGTGTYGATESRIVTFGSVSPELYSQVEKRTLWSPDPSRPQLCPRYTVDPDDPCY
jgi:hypothetical protein